MSDIVPDILENITKVYSRELMKNPITRKVEKAIKDSTLTYADAYKYANAIGNARAKAFKNSISSEMLPDGRMYFNIADRIIRDTLPNDFDDIARVSNEAQLVINKKMKVGIKTVEPKLDDDRLVGFIERLTSEPVFDDVAWILEDPVKQFCKASVDTTIKTNAEFQNKIGIKATVTRISDGQCCKWCDELAGVYTYPSVPSEVFARHDNCTCTIDYNGEKLSANKHSFR